MKLNGVYQEWNALKYKVIKYVSDSTVLKMVNLELIKRVRVGELRIKNAVQA